MNLPACPPLLAGAAALFWSHQLGLWWLGVGVALALEAPRIVATRLDIGETEFRRIADLCTLAFVVLAAWLTLTRGGPLPVLEILGWLPLVLLPLLLAQRYSAAQSVTLSALFLSMRGSGDEWSRRRADLAFPWVITCVLAAGCANLRSPAYYGGALALAGWALLPFRSRRVPVSAWIGALAIAAGIGWAGQLGLAQAQSALMNLALEWLDLGGGRTDPYRSTTDIGSIGNLKLEDGIVLRVDLPPGTPLPLLLHRASYNAYAQVTWLAREAGFGSIAPSVPEGSWQLVDGGDATRALRVHEYAPRGRAVLALPMGTVRIEELAAVSLTRNPLGAVQVERQPGLLTYRARWGSAAGIETAPGPFDLRMPPAEAVTVQRLANELGLAQLTPRAAVEHLARHLATRYSYSTWQPPRAGTGTPLAAFLTETRSGHCEYFATATVLLLRAAGIPARYATGFSVQEWSPREQAYVVRERHAHAWARAWVDGRWIDVDTTPPDWFATEALAAPVWAPAADLWSWLRFRWARWQGERGDGVSAGWLALVLPLAAVLVWRLRLRRTQPARPSAATHGRTQALPGADSDYYRIERHLSAAGLARGPVEPVTEWVDRVSRLRPDVDAAALTAIVRRHYRYRFDPAGLAPDERRALAGDVDAWLAARTSGSRAGGSNGSR